MRASLLCLAVVVLAALAVSAQTPGPNHVHITVLHLNDCYELMPAAGTDLGGVARVATLRKQLLAANPNTYTMLAGDLFAPSALSTTPVPNANGTLLTGGFQGEQMVVAMNMIGLDYACLGNHEADLRKDPFTANMDRSNFTWLSANALFQQYNHMGKSAVFQTKVTPTQSKQATVGVLGLTIDSNNRTGVQTWYGFDYSSQVIAPAEIESLNAQGADIIVALTHYDYAVDELLVERNAGISIVVGGHDHTVVQIEGKNGQASIYKADSNVRTVWVHELYVDPSLPKSDPNHFLHFPRLVYINSSFADDQPTRLAITPYLQAAYASFAAQGFNATRIIATLGVDLDMRNSVLAQGPTPSTVRMAVSIYESATYQLARLGMSDKVDLAMVNVGVLRLDDIVTKGTTLTEYDILRITPFTNPVWIAKVTGSYLVTLLELAEKQRAGTPGGNPTQYLVYTNVTKTAKAEADASGAYNWFISGVALNTAPGVTYNVATNSYLLGGSTSVPAPYNTFNPKSSPLDVVMLLNNQTGVPDGKGDPRRWFIDSLTRDYPPVYAGAAGPAAPVAPSAFVFADFNVRFNTLATDFAERLAAAISQALHIRQSRISIVQLSQSFNNALYTSAFISLAPNQQPDPISAQAAAADFVKQVDTPGSALRNATATAAVVPGSAYVSSSSTPPTKSLGAAAGLSASFGTLAIAALLAIILA